MPLEDYLPFQVYAFLLVFARVGAMLILMPGVGEGYIQPRIRIFFGATFALVVTPVIQPLLPPEPVNAVALFALVFWEVVIGLYFGVVARMLLLTMDTLGRIISFQSGLAAAQAFNPSISEQGSLIGLLLTTLSILVLFTLDLHHLMLLAVVDSYTVFEAGGAPSFEGMAEAVSRVTSSSFQVAVKFSAPFLVIGIIFFACLGILARLMPQLQIFFIGIPIQLVMGFVMLFIILGGLMGLFVEYYASSIAQFLMPN
jgi:flagellar biosynthetic protein FliR